MNFTLCHWVELRGGLTMKVFMKAGVGRLRAKGNLVLMGDKLAPSGTYRLDFFRKIVVRHGLIV